MQNYFTHCSRRYWLIPVFNAIKVKNNFVHEYIKMPVFICEINYIKPLFASHILCYLQSATGVKRWSLLFGPPYIPVATRARISVSSVMAWASCIGLAKTARHLTVLFIVFLSLFLIRLLDLTIIFYFRLDRVARALNVWAKSPADFNVTSLHGIAMPKVLYFTAVVYFFFFFFDA